MSPQEQIAVQARRLRSLGMSWLAIGRELGVSDEVARRAADPEYAERRREANRLRKQHKRAPRKNRVIEYRPPEEDAQRVIQAALWRAKTDTRTPFQRALGDPPPGRSALDQKLAMR